MVTLELPAAAAHQSNGSGVPEVAHRVGVGVVRDEQVVQRVEDPGRRRDRHRVAGRPAAQPATRAPASRATRPPAARSQGDSPCSK